MIGWRKEAAGTVKSILRLVPYLWPYRRRIYLSFVFALLVAIFWSVNLSVAFPVVKVLLQGQSLSDYVQQEIDHANTEIEKRTSEIKAKDAEIQRLDPQHDADDYVSTLRYRASQQQKLSDASRQLLVMSWLKSSIVPWLPRDQFDTLAAILGILLLATVLKGVCIFVQDMLVGSAVELTVMGIRKDCFRRALTLDYQTLTKGGTSGLMSRFTYDMEIMSHGLNLIGGKVVREPLKALCCVIGALFVSWQLTLLSLLFVPLVGVVFYRIGKKLKAASHRMMESMSRIYKTLEETFDGLKIVIAFDGARHHRQRLHRENKSYFGKALRIVKIDALTSPTTEFLGLVAAFMALLPGAYLVLRNTTDIWGIRLVNHPMDIAELSMLYVMLAGVTDPIRKMSTTYAKVKRAHAAGERIFGLLDTKPVVRQTEHPVPAVRHSQSIEFQDLRFTYPVGESGGVRPAALDGANLEVKAGEVIVVVGENGSGKSTMVNLLPRFYDPDAGRILIDGVNIRDMRLRDLRGQIGVVTQETLLFDDTIYENIRYGKRTANRGEVERAARQAHVMNFLEQLPEGFETCVGEKGCKLSGGQRQRVSLARAILRDPSILILDEATSAIDAQSERLIHEALRTFVQGRTTFVITHTVSPSILDFVTRIVVMDQGKIVAAGPHEQVLETNAIYQRLFHARSHRRDEAAGVPEGFPAKQAA